MWTMGHELFLTQFEAGESISAIHRGLRTSGRFQNGAGPPKSHRGVSKTPRGGFFAPKWTIKSPNWPYLPISTPISAHFHISHQGSTTIPGYTGILSQCVNSDGVREGHYHDISW